nr:immunoglobulin heavy chain junction region [Macaca mulatta]
CARYDADSADYYFDLW